MSSTWPRRAILGVASVATLVAAWMAPPLNDSTHVAMPARAGGVSDSKLDTVASGSRSLNDRLALASRGDRFGPESDPFALAVAGIPAPPPTETSAPVPPAPFVPVTQALVPDPPEIAIRVLGRIVEGGLTRVFISIDETNFVAGQGEEVGKTYRVELIEQERLTVRHLSTNSLRIIRIEDEGTTPK